MVDYKINGGTAYPGVQSQWEPIVKRLKAGGEVEYQNWFWNTWELPQLPMDRFHELKLNQGNRLSSLTTNDFENRNTEKTYPDVILETVVNNLQSGRRATNITIRFRVKIA